MKVAIIGNGIVGATLAFLLGKDTELEVTQFDNPTGQATAASAGIIAPWLSKRRNQKWYRLAREGAAYINKLAIENDMPEQVYRQRGVVYTRQEESDIDELLELGQNRLMDAPNMGKLKKLTPEDVNAMYPDAKMNAWGLLVTGGATIDGAEFVAFLNQRTNFTQIKLKNNVKIQNNAEYYSINGQKFEKVILATGAWLPETLEPLGYDVEVRPQKGQLIEVKMDQKKISLATPVLMPEGERDFIPSNDGQLIIGATHENDQGFNIEKSSMIIEDLLRSGQTILPNLTENNIFKIRVGTRAYTNDFAPFFGPVDDSNLLVASGLGSSGLTTGPMIAKLLADQVQNSKLSFGTYTNPVAQYVKVAK